MRLPLDGEEFETPIRLDTLTPEQKRDVYRRDLNDEGLCVQTRPDDEGQLRNWLVSYEDANEHLGLPEGTLGRFMGEAFRG